MKYLLILSLFVSSFATAQDKVTVRHGDTLFLVSHTYITTPDSLWRCTFVFPDSVCAWVPYNRIVSTTKDSVQLNKFTTSTLPNTANFINNTALSPYAPGSRLNDSTAALRLWASGQFNSNAQVGISAASATTGTIAIPMTHRILTVVPTGAITFNASAGVPGQTVTFRVTTSGTTSFVITFGTNFKKAGTLATGTTSGRIFAVSFLWDGTQWLEIGRTAAQT